MSAGEERDQHLQLFSEELADQLERDGYEAFRSPS